MTENNPNISGMKEDELKAELFRYRELFENAPFGIVQTTVEGKILKVNPAMARMLRYDPVGNDLVLVGNIIENLYVKPEQRKLLLDLALDREELFNFETQFRRKDEEIITCRLHLHRDYPASVRISGKFNDIYLA